MVYNENNPFFFIIIGDVGYQGEEGEKGLQGDKGYRGRDGTISYRYVPQGKC